MKKRVFFAMAAFSLLVLPLFLGIAEGALVTVCSSGCNSTTIQNGINLASNYDEVRIIDSIEYLENVTVNRSITLSSNSTTKPQIVGIGNQPAINITSDNVTVRNLTIKYNGTSGTFGVITSRSVKNASITSNDIYKPGTNFGNTYGVLFSNTNSSTISNNYISTTLGVLSIDGGINISSNSNSNNILSNTVSLSGQRVDGVTIRSSSSNILSNNNIYVNGTLVTYGISIITSSNNIIAGTTVNTNLTNNFGIYISTSVNNTFYDSTINATQAADVFLNGTEGGKDNYFVNVSFNKADVGVTSPAVTTRLFVQYRLDVSVINSTGNTINSVSVTGNDTNSLGNSENPTSNFSATTNSSGQISVQVLTEFMANGTYNATSGYLYFTNYTINASKTGYNTTSVSLNLTASTLVNITLTNTSGQSSNVDTYYILNNGIIEVVIANISSGRRNTGGFINISDVDPTVTGEMKRAYLNGTELYHRMDVYEDNSAEGVFGTVTKDVGGAGDSECHMSISTNIFKRVDCTTTKGTGRSKISYRVWKGVPYVDMYIFLAGTNNTNYLDTLPMPFAPSDPGASPPPGYGDARVTFNSKGCLASVGTDQGNCNGNKGVIDIPYKLSGGEVTYDLNLSLENPWIVDYRTTSGYKGAVQVWDCDGFTNPVRNECGDVLYRFKAAGTPYFWQTFPQNTSSGSVTGGTNSSFTRRYGLFLNGSLSWANVGIRESTIFVSNQSITNSTGGCVKDYSGDTLKCYPSSGVLSFAVTPNQNVTKMFITIENFTASTNSLFIYNSTSGTPSSGDLWIMLSNESGTWKYVNQTGGVSAKGCLINGTSIDENVCNDTGVYKDANNVMLFLSMGSGTQNIAIRDSAISSSSTTTTTTGSSGGGGGGGGGASPTTTTTLRNEPKERVIVPVEEIVPVEVPTDLPDVKIPEHVPNRIIKASAEILELKKDESAVIDIKNADMAIRRADIQYEEDVKDVTITIRQLVFRPEEVEEPETDVYRYIEINSSSDKVKTAKISFEVEESWISGRDDDIRLNHFKGGWKELPTKKTGKNGNKVKYEAETDSFSVFVISIAVPVTGEVPQETAAPAVQIHESLPYKPLIITILLILVIASFIKLQSVEKELKSRKLKVNVSSILQNPRSFEGARITLTDCVVNTFKQNGADWVSTANDGTGTINAIYSKKIDGKMSLEGVVAITSSGDPVLRIKKSKG